MNTAASTEWLDRSSYPFKHRYMRLKAGNMHYVDEGEGETILFVHGTPTWSYLYRDHIKALLASHRCLAIDNLGFGLSDKPSDFEGTPQAHSRNLSEFIRQLDLKEVTIVVHDFGGPIGLASAIAEPDRIKQVVLFNTWLWETESNPEAQKVDRIVNSAFGKFLYTWFNISPKVLLKQGFYDKKKLTRHIHQQYIGPFRHRSSRASLLNLARSLAGSSNWYQQQWEKLEVLDEKPWLILWGTEDRFITTDYLDRWKKRISQATVVEYPCGHFVQEEMGRESTEALQRFMLRP